MTENADQRLKSGNEHSDEISLKSIILSLKKWFDYLLSKWLVILLFGLLGGILGFTYAYLKKPVYVANSTFVLSDNTEGGGLSQYSNLASMVGIDIGGGSSSGIFSGDNILELYKSRKMLQNTLLSSAIFNGKRQLFIDRYISYNKLRDTKFKKVAASDLVFTKGDSSFTRTQDSVITVIVTDINKDYLDVSKPDKKLSIINVQVKANDELFAKEFVDQLVSNVNKFYVDTKTKKSAENLRILQHQTDSIRIALNGAISGVAVSIDANPNANIARQILKVPSQKKQIDAEANKAILTELVKNLEISKISLRKETLLIQVIDNPVYPLEKIRVGKVKSMIGAGFLFGFLTVLIIILRKILKNVLSDYE